MKRHLKEIGLLLAVIVMIAVMTRPAPPPPRAVVWEVPELASAFDIDLTQQALSENEDLLFYFEFKYDTGKRFTFTALRNSHESVDLRATLASWWERQPHEVNQQVTTADWEAFVAKLREHGIHRMTGEDTRVSHPTDFTLFLSQRGQPLYFQWEGPGELGVEMQVLEYLTNSNSPSVSARLLVQLWPQHLECSPKH